MRDLPLFTSALPVVSVSAADQEHNDEARSSRSEAVAREVGAGVRGVEALLRDERNAPRALRATVPSRSRERVEA